MDEGLGRFELVERADGLALLARLTLLAVPVERELTANATSWLTLATSCVWASVSFFGSWVKLTSHTDRVETSRGSESGTEV